MNGFIGALAAQLALQPVLPAADGIASRPRRPVAECLRAQRTVRAKLTAPSRRAYLQQLRRVWWADGAAVRMRVRVAAARPRPSRDHASAGCEPAADGPRAPSRLHVNASPHPANGARQCPGSFIAAAPTAAAGHRRIPRMGSGGVWRERAYCPLRSRRVALLTMCCRGASSGGRAWRHMPAKCIPKRLAVAIC